MHDHFYQSLKVEDFRGIKSLEINNLARVNLLVGRNGCGKTSVLESLFLLSAMSDPRSVIAVENQRGLTITEHTDLRNLFYRQKHGQKLTLLGAQGVGSRRLELHPEYGDIGVSPPVSPVSLKTKAVSSATGQVLTGLRFKFQLSHPLHVAGEDHPHESVLLVNGNARVDAKPDGEYEESMQTLFLHPFVRYDPELIDRMLREKRKDVMLQWLKFLEPKIRDVRINVHSIVEIDVGLDSFLPANNFGDGVGRMLTALGGVYGAMDGVLLIDEIERGLHVASIQHVLKMMLRYSEQNNVQIFMTAYSSDAVKSLGIVLDDARQGPGRRQPSPNTMGREPIACFWLEKLDNDEVAAYRYSLYELKLALDAGIDVRH